MLCALGRSRQMAQMTDHLCIAEAYQASQIPQRTYEERSVCVECRVFIDGIPYSFCTSQPSKKAARHAAAGEALIWLHKSGHLQRAAQALATQHQSEENWIGQLLGMKGICNHASTSSSCMLKSMLT